MEKWSETAWAAASRIYEAITRLPFITRLADGSLEPERFNFYITQDNLYIDVYSRVLAHIASRLKPTDQLESFLQFASDGVAVERVLHASYNPDPNTPMSAACLFYTSLLRAQATQPVEVEAAAILPCFWVYQKVGEHLLATARLDGNPYRAWIETYGDPAFDISTRRAIEICDDLAAGASPQVREAMTQAFVDCTRQEWYFWQSAYDMQLYPSEIL